MPKCHTSANRGHLSMADFCIGLFVFVLIFSFNPFASKVANATGSIDQIAILTAFETGETSINLSFDTPVDLKIAHLDDPARIIIDLPNTNFTVLEQNISLPKLISTIRFGQMSPGHSRIVLTLNKPSVAAAKSANAASAEHNLLLQTVDRADFAERVANDTSLISPELALKTDRIGQAGNTDGQGPFTLVIDPGHGGIDGGAKGKLGTQEKNITLAFGLAIRDALKNEPDVRVIMTRETDVFVGLNERVKIARQNQAELFLSIHGDSINLPNVRGATLYTLSDSASDAISSALAKQENLADSIAGLPPMQPDPDMNSILVDLLRQETATFSRELAGQIVIHLKENAVELINNPVRSAGFSVLTAPDVPSLLLEMGYLSNQEDELLMQNADWRDKTAAVIAKAVGNYAKGHRTRNSN